MTLSAAALLLASANPVAEYDALLRTLIETDTTRATGSCTAAAAKAGAALRKGGVPADSIMAFGDPSRPREGGLFAQVPGLDPTRKPLLLVAHIDTVPADPAEWTYPPFKLTSEGGYYYGRGIADNKAVAALLVEMLVDFHRAPDPPSRTIAMALTCGEETPDAFNGARWMATEGRRLVDPDLVLIPSGGATRDADGRPATITVSVTEKAQQNFRLEARGTPSHSSLPDVDNAIVTLARAVTKVAEIRFPVTITPVVRAQLASVAKRADPADAAAIRTLLNDPADTYALAAVSARPAWNALLRTTCVATVIDTGRQANMIASKASANINCRMVPGTTTAAVRATLVEIIADPKTAITVIGPGAESPGARPYPEELIGVVEASAAETWPGSTVIASMLTGATDAQHFDAVGIPAYGVTILPYDADASRVHAPDERVRIASIEEGRNLLRRLVRQLTR